FWIALFVVLARFCHQRLPGVTAAIVVPILWTGLEFFRSELYYLRFSWLNVGYALSGTALQPLAHWFGMYGLGFLAMAAAVGISRGSFKQRGLLAFRLAGVVVVILFLQAYVSWKPGATPARNALRVAGVQLEFASGAEVLEALDMLLLAQPNADL